MQETKHFYIAAPLLPRFETGFAILEELLCNHSQLVQCLPLGRLWPCLITRACQHTGEERLQVMRLLVRMLDTHTKRYIQGREGGVAAGRCTSDLSNV